MLSLRKLVKDREDGPSDSSQRILGPVTIPSFHLTGATAMAIVVLPPKSNSRADRAASMLVKSESSRIANRALAAAACAKL